jgi:hypothetical protein
LIRTATTLLLTFFLLGSARRPLSLLLSAYCTAHDGGDDTACIRAWVQAGLAAGAELLGSPGTYLYSDKIPLRNEIGGNWETACILGTLPAIASRVRIMRNKRAKTGLCGPFPAGIAIKRTNSATVRAESVVISDNEIKSVVGWLVGEYPPLDMGGMFISGSFNALSVTSNRVTSVGPRGIYIHTGADVTNAIVVNNRMKERNARYRRHCCRNHGAQRHASLERSWLTEPSGRPFL